MWQGKKRKTLALQHLLDGFKKIIDDCGLNEVDLTGGSYTLEKSKDSEDWVRERLDRAFANDAWWNMFPLCTLSVFHAIVLIMNPSS